ncbi:MAG: flagellin FliC [Acidobacteria bacterium]|nr:flagellin FliC [Acidobacteriota bacterium]
MISIQTNAVSIFAQDNLRVSGEFQSQTIRRLTSGYRINQSGDDAAGLAAANRFRNDVAELTQGVRNANDAISALQIIDGGLNNISKMLDRLKTLATEGASDTFTGSYASLADEYGALRTEIDRQANNINLGAANTGYTGALEVHIGGNVPDLTIAAIGAAGTTALGLATTALTNKTDADALLVEIDAAVDALALVQGKVGTAENGLGHAIQLASSQISNYSAAESRIRDTDVAAEAANLTKAQVLQQAGMAALAQANATPQAVLSLLRS